MRLLLISLIAILPVITIANADSMEKDRMNIDFSARVSQQKIAKYVRYIEKVTYYYKSENEEPKKFDYWVFDQGEVIAVSTINKEKPQGVRGESTKYKEFNFFFDRKSTELLGREIPR
jgi:hypothetical protein